MENSINSNTNNQEWACSICTLLNNNDVTECIACGTSRDGNTENSTAVWTCRICTTYNQMTNSVCQSCGAPMGTILEMETTESSDTYRLGISSNSGSNLTTREAISILSELLGIQIPSREEMTPRQEAEYYVFGGRSCRCLSCRLRAIRTIIELTESARTERQRNLSEIMMNEILPPLIMSTFNSNNPILQLLGSGSLDTLQQVLDRSLAETEGGMIPATKEEMKCLKCVDNIPGCLEKHHGQETCVICMEKFFIKNKESKLKKKETCKRKRDEYDNNKEESKNNNINCCQIVEMPCGHIFHKECIEEWLEKSDASCPICKNRINKKLDILKEDDNLNQDHDLNSINSNIIEESNNEI